MKMKHIQSQQALADVSMSPVDQKDLGRIEGGWCGTPVPGSLPPVPNPGPDPWFNRLGDIGQLGSIGQLGHVAMR